MYAGLTDIQSTDNYHGETFVGVHLQLRFGVKNVGHRNDSTWINLFGWFKQVVSLLDLFSTLDYQEYYIFYSKDQMLYI